jgi:DNA-binding helix-hairpin-helix protein with protein kinase domain
MRRLLAGGRKIELAEQIGKGAEGAVFAVAGNTDLCAKLYYDPTPERARRLEHLIEMAPRGWRGDHSEHHHVAWPLALLTNSAGEPDGVLMPRVEGTELLALFDPAARAVALPDPTWRQMLAIAGRVARLFAMLHEAGIIIGDVSARNLLIVGTGHVTLIDCDTVRIVGEHAVDVSARKITPEWASPQLFGDARHVSTVEDDLFGLAILVCQLLMEGDHPFEGVPASASAGEPSIETNIKMHNDRITHPERLVLTDGLYPPEMLPRDVLRLARTTFEEGFYDPLARPTARRWEAAATRGGFEVMGCRVNARHLYAGTLPSCLWCERIRQGREDRYPPARGRPTAPTARSHAARPAAQPVPPARPSQRKPGSKPTQPTPPTHQAPKPPVPAAKSGTGSGLSWVVYITVIVIFIVIVVL